MSEPVEGPTLLKIFSGADGQFTIYDDDGEIPRYLDGSDAATLWIRFLAIASSRAILEINFRIEGDFGLVLFRLAWLKKSVAVARATAQCRERHHGGVAGGDG